MHWIATIRVGLAFFYSGSTHGCWFLFASSSNIPALNASMFPVSLFRVDPSKPHHFPIRPFSGTQPHPTDPSTSLYYH